MIDISLMDKIPEKHRKHVLQAIDLFLTMLRVRDEEVQILEEENSNLKEENVSLNREIADLKLLLDATQTTPKAEVVE